MVKPTRFLLMLGIVCLSFINVRESISADTIIYGVNAYSRADVIEINLTRNTYRKVGDLLFDTQASDQDPVSKFLYYFEWTSSGNRFAYWDPATRKNTLVRTYNPAPGFVAKRMAFTPDGNTLYMMDNQDRIYEINKYTGNISLLGAVSGVRVSGSLNSGDMAFIDNTLYLVTADYLFTIDLGTLRATRRYANMLPGSSLRVWSGLAYCNGSLYASDAQPGSPFSAIFRINPSTGNVSQLISTRSLLNDLCSCPAVGN